MGLNSATGFMSVMNYENISEIMKILEWNSKITKPTPNTNLRT